MALTANFKRFAYNHGDIGTWQPLFERLIKAGGVGGLGIEASNVGGAITVSKGFGGIDDGTLAGFGAIEVTTGGTVSAAAGTAGSWHALEFSVSGTAVTFYLTAIAAATDESFMTTTMKGYYDESKQGYYRIASRRIIAFIYLRAALALGRIVNCESGKLGFKGIRIVPYITEAGATNDIYIATHEQAIGDWNMRAAGGGSTTKGITWGYAIGYMRSMKVTIRNDANTTVDPLDRTSISIPQGGFNLVYLERLAGGYFDTTDYDSTSYNRGWIYIEYET